MTSTKLSMRRNVGFRYSIASDQHESITQKCLQHIHGDIVLHDGKGNAVEKIGEIYGVRIMYLTAVEKELDLWSIFEQDEFLRNVAETVYDPDTDVYTEELENKYRMLSPFFEVLVIKRVELLPSYRGSGIGEDVIKDFFRRFSGGCGVVVIAVAPSQFECDTAYRKDDWARRMAYTALEQDSEKAHYSLLHYLTSMGFDYYPEISEKFLFVGVWEVAMESTKTAFY